MATNDLFTSLDPMAALDPTAEDIEVEVVPDSMGGVDITEDVEVDLDGLRAEGLLPKNIIDAPFDANLAEYLTDQQLAAIAADIIDNVETDIRSRQEWAETYAKGLDVLGMRYEDRTDPWEGACGVYATVLIEAAVRFQAEMITETFPAQGPVKTKIIGTVNRPKEEAAERVREDMNHELTDKMVEYRPEHERLLFSLGLSGSGFKKVYDDPTLGRQTAVFVTAEDMIIPYGASTIYNAERVTHVMRKTKNDFAKLKANAFYRDIDLGEPTSNTTNIDKKRAEEQGYKLIEDNRYQFYECHCDYDIPGLEDEAGVALPYVITVDRDSQQVLGVRRNWEESDPKRIKRQHFVQYTYIPGFGAYGIGLISLIGGYALAGTLILRQLVDSGTLANLPGGLKTKGLRIKGDDTPIGPGEWRDVDLASGTVRDNIMPLPYKEPSATLATLLDKIIDEARRLASISDLKISDMSAQAPVGTTLALLERTLKTMSAVQARVHASLSIEFKLLKEIIASRRGAYTYDPEKAPREAKASDFASVEVIPVSDPNASTMAQRIMQYQAATQLSATAPQIYDLPYLHRQMIETLGVKNADKVVPLPEDQKPRDPISENMSLLTSKPVKAFLYQEHQAHIAVHMALLQDPMIQQMLGQTPMGPQMGAAIMAHVAEHLAFAYRAQVEQQLGVPLPPPDAPLPPEVEVQLSRLVAQAAQQLLQTNIQKAQQAQAEQQMQDPEMQLKMKEMQLKEKDSLRKDMDSERDYEVQRKRLSLDERKLDQDAAKHVVTTRSQERQQDKQIKADVVKTMLTPKSPPPNGSGKPQPKKQ